MRGDERDVFEAECACLATLWQSGGHVNIIRFLGATHKGLSQYNAIVLEYCAGGSFRDLLHVRGTQMRLGEALEIYMQVGRGLEYVHSHHMIHRDVK
jgi:serine/threonine protein kinase